MKDYKNPIYATMKMARANLSRIADNIYQQGYEAGKAATPFTDMEEAENKAYNRGLNDAWGCAKKIVNMSEDEFDAVFDDVEYLEAAFESTPQETIAKIREYEDKQKQDDWRDIPSDEMTLDQARRAVKQLRAEVVGKISVEGE